MKQAYADRARLRMMKNDMKGALSDLDNAVARGYRSDEVYSSRAHVRTIMRDFEGAVSDFNVAISMNPTNARHYLGRGSARSSLGDEDGAVADYTYLINGFEDEERERRAAGKPERRVPSADKKSPIISGPESATTKTAKTGQTQREVTKIEAQSVMGMRLGPGMTPQLMEYLSSVAGAYNGRGLIYGKKGDSEAAIADLGKSITINAFFGTYYNRARELRKRGDLALAVADFTKAMELRPKMAPFHLERGVTLLQMGKEEEAEKDFADALALDPELKTTIETRRLEAKDPTKKRP